MSVMVLDAGNSIIKAKFAKRENGEIAFPHAMKQLTESENEKIIKRAGFQNQSMDYLRINSKPYVVGESAERYGLITQRTGTARYTRDYYSVFVDSALARFYEHSREGSVFGSHLPKDVKSRQDLMEPIIGDWYVEVNGEERHLRVSSVNTFDEPVGGLINVLLCDDGQYYQYADANDGGL